MRDWLKRIVIAVLVIGFAYAVTTIGVAVYQQKTSAGDSMDFRLEDLKKGEEFQFGEFEWGVSAEEVSLLLPYPLEAKSANSVSVHNRYSEYTTKNPYAMDGYGSVSTFRFKVDQLEMVQLSFLVVEGYEEWFQKCVDELRRLYGEESDKAEFTDMNGSDEIKGKGYRWDTEETTLQIVLVSGSHYNPTVVISVANKNLPEDG